MKLSVISLMFAIVLGAQSGKTPTHIHHMPPLTRPPPPTHHPPPTQLPISVLLEILGGAFLAQPYSNAGAGKHPRPPVYEFSLLQQAVVGPAAPRLRTLVGSISERFAAFRPLALVSRRGALRMQVTTAYWPRPSVRNDGGRRAGRGARGLGGGVAMRDVGVLSFDDAASGSETMTCT